MKINKNESLELKHNSNDIFCLRFAIIESRDERKEIKIRSEYVPVNILNNLRNASQNFGKDDIISISNRFRSVDAKNDLTKKKTKQKIC